MRRIMITVSALLLSYRFKMCVYFSLIVKRHTATDTNEDVNIQANVAVAVAKMGVSVTKKPIVTIANEIKIRIRRLAINLLTFLNVVISLISVVGVSINVTF